MTLSPNWGNPDDWQRWESAGYNGYEVQINHRQQRTRYRRYPVVTGDQWAEGLPPSSDGRRMRTL